MNSNKEALIAELKELTQELVDMGNYFNSAESGDIGINSEEAALLNSMQKEIDVVKLEIAELQQSTTNTEVQENSEGEETFFEKIKKGLNPETLFSKISNEFNRINNLISDFEKQNQEIDEKAEKLKAKFGW